MNRVDIKQEDDEYLLLYIADKDENPDYAKLALKEFFFRYKDFVANLCSKVLVNIFASKDSDDLFSEVFQRVYEKADTFDLQKSENRTDVRKSIEVWISAIARNMRNDWFEQDKKLSKKHNEYGPIYDELSKESPSSWTPLNKEAVEAYEEVFKKLSKPHRDIVIQSGLYFDLEKNESDMPSEVIEKLANEHGTSPENIRQIRSRFKRRVLKEIK